MANRNNNNFEYLVLENLFNVESRQRNQLRHLKLTTQFISKVYLLKRQVLSNFWRRHRNRRYAL